MLRGRMSSMASYIQSTTEQHHDEPTVPQNRKTTTLLHLISIVWKLFVLPVVL